MWENYYSTLKKLPERLKELAPFIVEASTSFKHANAETILDLGCGAGRHTIYLSGQGFNVVALDTSRSALKITGNWARQENLKVALIKASMTSLPFRDFSFDVVVSVSVIHHGLKRDIAKTVNEIHRTLKKAGIFLANVASTKDPRYGEGTRIEDGTFRMMEAFEEERFEEVHHFLTKDEIYDTLLPYIETELKLQKDRPYYWEIKARK